MLCPSGERELNPLTRLTASFFLKRKTWEKEVLLAQNRFRQIFLFGNALAFLLFDKTFLFKKSFLQAGP